MDLGIAGRTALVCGASRGMGFAIARRLAAEGVDIVMVARTPGPLNEAALRIEGESPVRVIPVSGDITTEAGRAAALAACSAPDILITNADGPRPGNFRDHTRNDWMAALDALMLAPIALIQATIDGMVERRFGRIINITSRSVKIAQPELSLSNGARSGLVGFVGGIAREVARHNVTINNLLPGIFATDAQRRHVSDRRDLG
jgi:3-oxoacyl-[acyl-carrier protein] reductase